MCVKPDVPKLIAIDLDGTLLNSEGMVSKRSIKALRALKALGSKVILCTGRPPRYISAVAEQLELNELIVAYNGAAILDLNSNQVSYRQQLAADLALELISSMRQTYPDVMIGMETHHGWYLDEALFALRKASLVSKNASLPDGCGMVETFIRDKVIKLYFRHPKLAAWELSKALSGLDVYCTWSQASLLEVLAAQVNKQEAIAFLAGSYGFSRQQVAAFGDQANDLELILWAGLGVAMDNASSELKAAAQFVTTSHDEDGVARVLEQWL